MKYFFKIDRLAAWLLFICLLLYFITGFSMTKGIISPALATKLHISYLTYIILAAFVTHTSFAIHLAFKRWRFWNAGGKTVLLLFYLLFISFFIWVDKFYARKTPTASPVLNLNANINSNVNTVANRDNEEDDEDSQAVNVNTANPLPTNATVKPANTNTSTNTSAPSVKTFTLTELAQYNGQSGRPAYVAVDGVVYDVTSVFFSGTHFSHLAGRDLSAEFNGQHNKSSITKYPVVGQLK
jgi:predicted heme/steroid binding protein